jgi:hypothetical protein
MRQAVASIVILTMLASTQAGCGDTNRNRQPDIVLSGTEKQLAATVKSQFKQLEGLARNPGKSILLQVGEGEDAELLQLSFVKNRAANYEHPRLARLATGEVLNLVWGFQGIIPTIKCVDDNGNTLKVEEKALEFPIEIEKSRGRDRGTADLIAAGIKIAAIAFAIWLGAKIAGAVIAAIAFIAFNAMLIGLIVAAAAVLVPLAKKVLDFLGIDDIDDVKPFFERTVSDIVNLFKEISNLLKEEV